jgi:predicted PurR-regulated permease PerM
MRTEPQQPVDETKSGKIFFDRSQVSSGFMYRVWYIIGAVVLTGLLLILFWQGTEVILLVFAGILLAVFLRSVGNWISDKTGISKNWSLTLVLLTVIGLTVLNGWFFYPSLRTQFEQLSDELPRAVAQLRQQLSQSSVGQRILEQVPTMKELGDGKSTNLLGRISGYFSSVLGAFVNFVVIIVFGIYFAFNPMMYYNGFLKLIPGRHQKRAGEILDVIAYNLRRWLIGRLAVMALNGIITAVALWFLGVPMPIALGVLTALLNFIPNIGPFLAAIPAVLLALTQSPTTATYTVILYICIQGLDGYILEPLVQQRAVDLPPVLVLAVQLLFGIFFGFLGVVLAVPVLAIVYLVVQMIYVEDILGHNVEFEGKKEVVENSG